MSKEARLAYISMTNLGPWKEFKFYPSFGGGKFLGGPFTQLHRDLYGRDGYFLVKMAKEIDLPCDASVPTVDFSLPDDKLLKPALKAAINAHLAGKIVAVGCMGGTGRTGLFFGVLSAILNRNVDPVVFTRSQYKSHAIETDAQMEYVRKFTRRHTWFTRGQRLKVGFTNMVRKTKLVARLQNEIYDLTR